jgi:hypothetical protein
MRSQRRSVRQKPPQYKFARLVAQENPASLRQQAATSMLATESDLDFPAGGK